MFDRGLFHSSSLNLLSMERKAFLVSNEVVHNNGEQGVEEERSSMCHLFRGKTAHIYAVKNMD